MQWLKIIAILIIINGIFVLIRPDFMRKYFEIFTQGSKIYLAAVIKAIFALIFLFGAKKGCAHEWVIILFGILALAGAVFIIALPQKSRAMTAWFAARNNTILRILSLIYLLIGALLIYSA
jgi:uncharacterized protein YjeT (DUF2065 family)